MNSKEIEFLIGNWEELADDYRHQASKFKNTGYDLAGAEFITIANTLDRCASDLKNKYAMGRV